MTQTVLVVDDERKLREMVCYYLQQEGYRTLQAANGREALLVVRQERPDLVLLDLMMPEVSGVDFLRAHVQGPSGPVIVLTARVEDADKIVGLELGADDYVTKPFNVRELMARVKAVLRRASRPPAENEVLIASDIVLDRGRFAVRVGQQPVELTRSEFELLATLMSAPGRVFGRLDLLDKVAGDAYEGYERTIDVHIRNLRTKIEPDPKHPRYVETIYGMGYRFAEA